MDLFLINEGLGEKVLEVLRKDIAVINIRSEVDLGKNMYEWRGMDDDEDKRH